jgi:hypothetical protein
MNYTPVRIDNQVWRIFPLEADLLMINCLCEKHNVRLVLGGDPNQGSHDANFMRHTEHNNFTRTAEYDNFEWVVAYLYGSFVGLTNVEDEWEHCVADPTHFGHPATP